MEPQTPPRDDNRSSVDTSRPFRSVKEAVATFGERLLVGEIYSPKPYTFTPPKNQEIIKTFPVSSPLSSPGSSNSKLNHEPNVLDAIKRLESELEDAKVELKVLKQKESETEIALASLNAELHKNMAKLAEVEAAAAKEAAAKCDDKGEDVVVREEETRKELVKRMENNPSLAHILSISEGGFVFGGGKGRKVGMMMMKKKPIVPLVGDWFFKKKGSLNAFHGSLYGSPHFVFN